MSDELAILREALNNLDAKLGYFERLVDNKIQDSQQAQRDLFADPADSITTPPQQQDPANMNVTANESEDIDPRAVAKRLDKAIERVEQLLREG